MSQLRLNQLSIVHRIYIGFAVLSLVIALGGGGIIWLAKQISSGFNNLTENNQVTQNLASQLGTSAFRTGINILDMDRAGDLAELDLAHQEANNSASELDTIIAQLEKHAKQYQLTQITRDLSSTKTIVAELKEHDQRLKVLKTSYINNDEAVRSGLAAFLLQSSDLKKEINQIAGPAAAYDSYIKDMLDIVMERFGLIEFLLSNMVNTKDTQQVADIVKRVQYNSEVFNEYMVSLFDEVPELDNKAFKDKVQIFNDQISADDGIVENYVGNRRTVAEISDIASALLEDLASLDAAVSKMVDRATSQSMAASDASQGQINFTVNAVSIVAPIAFLFAIALAFWLAGLIRKPLTHTQEQMHKLEQGDFSQIMRGKYQGEFAKLVVSINSLIEQMRGVFEQMQSAGAKLTSVSDGNNQTAIEVKTKLEQQTAELSSVATAVTEMESAIKEVAASVDSSRDLSQTIEQQIDQGQNVMDENMAMIDSLDATLQKTSSQVDNLADASKKIGSIIEVIEGIAEKTNLLALNAAIEAARAGEQGRGFAVVADEVRTLAAQTAESTESVRNMVTTIQRESQQVFDAMAGSREQMTKSKELVGHSSQAMHTIRENMGEMRSMSDHISVAAQEQHHVASEVTRNVNVIASVAEDNYTLIENVAGSSEELSAQVNAIEAMLKRFVLK